MKQLFQSYNSGELFIEDVPVPLIDQGSALVQTGASLVSAGTERMVINFAEKNLWQKARSRPDLVRQTIEKARREGILTTFEAVKNRLDKPTALGYSCAGTVIKVGADLPELQVGDRVACAGGGYASHAEVVSVPRNLLVRLPDNVDFESAAFTTLGAIAMQGIRLAEVKLGEVVTVIGLGLLGQLTVQMLKAAGCLVIGMDIQPQRTDLAQQLGADAVATTSEDLTSLCQQLSNGYGVDAVLITADTKSNEPVEVAGEVARDKGIVVAVGAVGLNIPRKIYYTKELDLRISRSYGPGRYDFEYEEKGHDYPYAYVRWTEQRNMQAFGQLVSQGRVNVQPLITHRFPITAAAAAYDLISGKTDEAFLGVLLTYPDQPDLSRRVILRDGPTLESSSSDNGAFATLQQVRVGVIGAGGFANATLLPAMKKVGDLALIGIASGGGLNARTTADRFDFSYATTDVESLLNDPAINTIAILTRHHLHARQVVAALEAGKHTFVEKPLCLTEAELQSILTAYEAAKTQQQVAPLLMVGFNRRFAPFIVELKRYLQMIREPLMLHYRVNAGFIPQNHWTQDIEQGGGRLLGEGCHFIDLLIYLAGDTIHQITTRALPDSGRYSQDNLLITLEFKNGSIGMISYVANGDRSLGKEYLEVFGGGLAARMDDYRTLVIRHGNEQIKRTARLRQEKGHQAEWQAISAYLTGQGVAPIPFTEIIHSTEATLAAQRSLQSNEPVSFTAHYFPEKVAHVS